MPTLIGSNSSGASITLPPVRDGGTPQALPSGAFSIHLTTDEIRGLLNHLHGLQASGLISFYVDSDEAPGAATTIPAAMTPDGVVGNITAVGNNTAVAAGASGNFADAAHQHNTAFAAVGAITTIGVKAAGTAATVAHGDHVHDHGDALGGTLHADATNALDGFETAARVLRHEQTLAAGQTMRLVTVTGTPAAKAANDVHADFLGNDASNDFPGAFTNPDVPRNLIVTFAGLWDGGDVTVIGTDQYDDAVTEVFTSNPGGTTVGVKIFKTTVSATKGAVGVQVVAASIGMGDKVGFVVPGFTTTGNVAVTPYQSTVLVAGAWAREAATVDATYDAFLPTTIPDGATDYELVVLV